MVKEKALRAAYGALAFAFALVLALPALVAPEGREAAALGAAVDAIVHGHLVRLPAHATPGTFALTAIAAGLSSVPGRGLRVLVFVVLVALGPVATVAFGARRERANAVVVATASLAGAWFGSVFFDFDRAGSGELFAHFGALVSFALVGRATFGRARSGSVLAALVFAFAAATSLRVVPYLPILLRLARTRANEAEARAVVAGSGVLAAAAFFAFLALPGASAFSSLRFDEGLPFVRSVAELATTFRPTGALVVVAALVASVRWTDERARPTPDRDALAFLVLALASAVLPYEGGVSRFEPVVVAAAVVAAIVARAFEGGNGFRTVAIGTVAIVLVGSAAAASNSASKSRGNRPTGLFVKRYKTFARALVAGDEEGLLASFTLENAAFYPAEARAIGRFLKDVAPKETLCVTVGAPEIHRHARLYPSPGGALDVSTAPSAAAAERARWIVAPTGTPPVAGYATRAAFPHYVVLERAERE